MSDTREGSTSSEASIKTLTLEIENPITDNTPVLKGSDVASVPKDDIVANQEDAGAAATEDKVDALLKMPDETTFKHSFETLALSITDSKDSSESAIFNQNENQAEKQNSFDKLAVTSSGKSDATDEDSFSIESLRTITATTMLLEPFQLVQLPAIPTRDPNDKSETRELPDMEAACKFWKTFSDEEYIDSTIKCEMPDFYMSSLLPKALPPLKIANMPPKTTAEEIVRKMLAENENATTLVEIGEHRFDCIGALLKTYSVWFQHCDWRLQKFKLSESDVPHEAFSFFYDWARCKKPVPEDMDFALQLLQATAYLKVDLLQPEVWHVLTVEANCEQKAFEIYSASKKYALLDDLRQVMLSRIRKYFLPFVATDRFLNLKATEVANLLSLDTIGVNTEVEVLYALLLWLGSKPEKRLKFMQKLMRCVRFGHMPVLFLMKLREDHELPKEHALFQANRSLYLFVKDTKNMDLVNKAVWFIGNSSPHDNSGDLLESCLKNELPLWHSRKWIYDAKCAYHKKDLVYPPIHDITVTLFNEYIKLLMNDESVDFEDIVNVEYMGDHKEVFKRKECPVSPSIKRLERNYVFFKELEEARRLEEEGDKNELITLDVLN